MKGKILLIILFVILIIILLVFITIFIASGAFLKAKYLEPWDENYYKKFSDDRIKLVSQAILAANGHNMQPWLVKLDKNDNNVMYLYVNTDRLTLNVDPYARQTMVSQGTFLEYMNVSAKKLGYDLKTDLFPDGQYDENNLVESMKNKAVAKITLNKTDKIDTTLYQYMFLSDTNRGEYKKDSLTNEQVNNLLGINEYDNIELKIFQDNQDLDKLGNYAIEGAKIESRVDRINKETYDIFRPNEYQKNKYRYGFSVEGQGTQGPMKFILEGLLTLIPGLNSENVTAQSLMDSTKLEVENTPAYAMILSKDNSRVSQVESGIIYSRLILKAHSLGLVMQPPSQVLEEYDEMREEYKNIHKDYAKNGETIQMFYRIGQKIVDYPQSMRQDVMSFIVD